MIFSTFSFVFYYQSGEPFALLNYLELLSLKNAVSTFSLIASLESCHRRRRKGETQSLQVVTLTRGYYFVLFCFVFHYQSGEPFAWLNYLDFKLSNFIRVLLTRRILIW